MIETKKMNEFQLEINNRFATLTRSWKYRASTRCNEELGESWRTNTYTRAFYKGALPRQCRYYRGGELRDDQTFDLLFHIAVIPSWAPVL